MSQKRAIFEEVASGAKSAPVTGQRDLQDAANRAARRSWRVWVGILALMVMSMIIVGALTRLTDSGLSITEWNLFSGALPPLNAADWDAAFALYQGSPEYLNQNAGMSLDEFRTIYWWEWSHRQLGRTMGVVWAIGALYLLARRRTLGQGRRILGLGVLIGLQGTVGWLMVSTGLTADRVDVASYALALHLGGAFLLLGFLVHTYLMMKRGAEAMLVARRAGEAKLFSMATGLLHLTACQVLLGALVAGIDAGRSFTDWPLMAGRFFPEGAFDLAPIWRNLFENPGLVQFVHRLVAYLLVVFAIVVWRRGRKSANRHLARAFNFVGFVAVGQVVLGIITVLNVAPMGLALAHQQGAVLLFILILRARFYARYPLTQSLR